MAKNVVVEFATPEGGGYSFIIRDQATGLPLAELSFTAPALAEGFHQKIRGEVANVVGVLFEYDKHTGPTHREVRTVNIEAPLLPEDKASRAIVRAEILRPHETHGWRGNPEHVGDPRRIARQLPDRTLYRVDFERLVPDLK
jgi:hypothetical protein